MMTRLHARERRRQSTIAWIALTMALSIGGCANSGGNDCAWARVITLDPGDRLTAPTKRAILAHNLKVREFCRR